MKPVSAGGHAAYRNALRNYLHARYPNLSVITKPQWKIYETFRDLDLSAIDSMLEDKYSIFGSKPRPPFCMFRSYPLSLAFHVPAITAWADAMRVTPLYAILSGFAPDDTPASGRSMIFSTVCGTFRGKISRTVFSLSAPK